MEMAEMMKINDLNKANDHYLLLRQRGQKIIKKLMEMISHEPFDKSICEPKVGEDLDQISLSVFGLSIIIINETHFKNNDFYLKGLLSSFYCKQEFGKQNNEKEYVKLVSYNFDALGNINGNSLEDFPVPFILETIESLKWHVGEALFKLI